MGYPGSTETLCVLPMAGEDHAIWNSRRIVIGFGFYRSRRCTGIVRPGKCPARRERLTRVKSGLLQNDHKGLPTGVSL